MQKANDEKFISYLLTVIIAGLLLLIFSGLRNLPSYVIFSIIVLLFLIEVVKAVSEGFEIG